MRRIVARCARTPCGEMTRNKHTGLGIGGKSRCFFGYFLRSTVAYRGLNNLILCDMFIEGFLWRDARHPWFLFIGASLGRSISPRTR